MQGEKKGSASSSGSIDKFSCTQKYHRQILNHSTTLEEHEPYLDKELILLNNHVSFQIHLGSCGSEIEGTVQRSQPITHLENNT
jgi:hypothetical protein